MTEGCYSWLGWVVFLSTRNDKIASAERPSRPRLQGGGVAGRFPGEGRFRTLRGDAEATLAAFCVGRASPGVPTPRNHRALVGSATQRAQPQSTCTVQVLPGHKRPRCSTTQRAEPQSTCTVQVLPGHKRPRCSTTQRAQPPAQVHGAGSPLPQRRQVRSATVLARCVAPWAEGPLRVPRGGLPSRLYAVSGRPEPLNHVCTGEREPAPCPWPRPREGPFPQEWEKACAEPHARGCGPRPQTSPAPGAGHGGTEGNHEHTLKKEEKRAWREGGLAPCRCSGARLFVWLSADTPWGGGLFLSLPFSWGEGPSPG